MALRRHTLLGQNAAAAARIFNTNEHINQILIAHLDPAAWNAKLAVKPPAQVRTIAAIFIHVHNVRAKWIRLTAPHLEVPAQLRRSTSLPQQVSAALAESATGCAAMPREAFDGSDRIKEFLRDGWARPWPVGPEMLCYMISHEAHHRGQVCMLSHQLGFPLPGKITSQMWNWERLWNQPFPTRKVL